MATHTLNSDLVQVGAGGGAPAFQNSWVNIGIGFAPAGFWKDAHGHVHLDGVIKSGTIGQIAFTLPAGYLPADHKTFCVMSGGNVAGRVDVDSTGAVTIVAAGSNAYVSLCGITFLAAG